MESQFNDKAGKIDQKRPEQPIDVEMTNVETSSVVKLTPFWSSNPQIWFDTAELQFKLLNITSDKKKFLHVLTALSPDISDKISDVIKNPPDTDMFLTIKRALLSRLTPSDEAQLELLLSGLELGDRRPSDFLRRITTLAGNNFSRSIIKTLWVRKLPEVLRLTLVAQPDTLSMDELSITADKIYDAMNRSSKISAIDTPSTSNFKRPPLNNNKKFNKNNSSSNSQNSTPTLQSIVTRLDAMEKRLNNLTNLSGGNRSRSRSRDRPLNNQQRNRSNSGNRNYNNFSSSSSSSPGFNGAWCAMHNRWGTRAFYCNQPCTFLKDNQMNSVATAQSKND